MHVRSARPSACIDTIFKGLNFFVHHHKNEYFCLWEWGRKRLRFARAGILGGHGSGTLERLEMATQEQSYQPRTTREASGTERRGTQRRSAVRRQTGAGRNPTFF